MSEPRKIKVTADVEVPTVPNFLRLENGSCLPLWALSDVDLKRIGELWTEKLIARAGEQRAAAKGTYT